MRFETIGEVDAASRLAMVNAAQTAWLDTPSLFCPDISLGQARIQGYERSAGPPPEFTPTTVEQITTNVVGGVVGTAAGHSLPPQIAFVVSLLSSLPGGRNRGRVYTPPPPEGVCDQTGIVTDPTIRATWIQGIAESVESSLIPVQVDHIVHSLKYGSTEEITQYVGKTRVDTQRRRRTRG